MACNHKFITYLNLERLDFRPTTLIVGTFNPSWPLENKADWFYGRKSRNYFWDVLPRLYNPNLNLRKQNHVHWKNFCTEHSIALTDIIMSINDADETNKEHQNILRSYLDTSIADYFAVFQFTELKELVNNNPTIKNVYLTRQAGVDLFDARWALLEEYALKNPARNLRLRKLITPSASARFQIKDYKLANPSDRSPLRNFIFKSWQEQWHF